MKRNKISFIYTGSLFVISLILILGIVFIDVEKVGPKGTVIGFSTINLLVYERICASTLWKGISDCLFIFSLLIACTFAIEGLSQLVSRKAIKDVDKEILLLGLVYLVIVLVYVVFEKNIINYRPVLVEGYLEASFPSSHVMMTVAIVGTANKIYMRRIGNSYYRKYVSMIGLGVMICITIGRLLSGMHWLTDIMGGLIIGLFFISFYESLLFLMKCKANN